MGVFRPGVNLGTATKAGSTIRLTGTVDPNDLVTTARLEYGTNSGNLDRFTNVALPFGVGPVAVTNVIWSGLTPGKLYYFRLTASNRDGSTLSPIKSVSF